MASQLRAVRAAMSAERRSLSHQLRESIRARGLTAYALSRTADADPKAIAEFLRGERDLRLGTADRIAEALGLRLVDDARRARR